MIGSRKLVHEENGGRHACTNGLRVARSAVESKLLTGIKAELSTPDYLEEFKLGVRRLWPTFVARKTRNAQAAISVWRS